MPDLAEVVPIFNVESVEAAEERIEQPLAPQGRVRVDRLQQALPRHRAGGPRPGRAARAVQPRLPRLGDPDRTTRSTSGSPTASSTSSGGCAERSAERVREALDNAGQLFKRLRTEMEESGLHTYPAGPWHAGLEPFPRRSSTAPVTQPAGQLGAALASRPVRSGRSADCGQDRAVAALARCRELEAADQLVRNERPVALVRRDRDPRAPGSSPATRTRARGRGR